MPLNLVLSYHHYSDRTLKISSLSHGIMGNKTQYKQFSYEGSLFLFILILLYSSYIFCPKIFSSLSVYTGILKTTLIGSTTVVINLVKVEGGLER